MIDHLIELFLYIDIRTKSVYLYTCTHFLMWSEFIQGHFVGVWYIIRFYHIVVTWKYEITISIRNDCDKIDG